LLIKFGEKMTAAANKANTQSQRSSATAHMLDRSTPLRKNK